MKREIVNQGQHYELQYEAGKISPGPAAEVKGKKPAAASKRNKFEKKPGTKNADIKKAG